MVLADLGRRINGALSSLGRATVIDTEVLEACLKDIARALLDADVNVKLVGQLRENVKSSVQLNTASSGLAKRRMIQKAVFDELCRLVDPGKAPFSPVKGQQNVFMFVGLQGAGKTTTCTKLATYYAKRGWKVALVCADTFRAGAFDQLKQSATKARIPFYGSYTEVDPAIISKQGVEQFKREKYEIIIVDTSGRHKQESALFDEMKQIEYAVQPDTVIFVLDGTIGQQAYAQAKAFGDAISVGAIIITKMDGHAKGGGAISAVAATNSPIIFIGTGEHAHEFDAFSAHSFVQKMLGLGDTQALQETMQTLSEKMDPGMIDRLTSGQFSFADFREQLNMIMGLGPLSQIVNMFPGGLGGLGEFMKQDGVEEAGGKSMKGMMCIMDSMTQKELDSEGPTKMFPEDGTRIERIARGCGKTPDDIIDFIQQYRTMSKTLKNITGNKGLMGMLNGMGGGGGGGGASGKGPAGGPGGMMNPQMMQQLSKALGPMGQAFGGGANGGGGLANMMQSMMSALGGGGPNGGGGGGAGGGMPDLGGMMDMLQGGGVGGGASGGNFANLLNAFGQGAGDAPAAGGRRPSRNQQNARGGRR